MASFAHIDQPLFISERELRSLGRYALRRVMGSSASGSVCAAYDPETGQEVAIHMMRTLPGHADARELLLAEAEAWQSLGHPSIAAILDIGTFVDAAHPSGRSHGVFVVRECLPGIDLQRWLDALPANVTPSVLDQVLDRFTTVGRGLAAAHSAGLVHRDVRPANMMVSFDDRAWLIDFASVHAVPVRASHAAETPRFPAPELRTGAEADARSDQYSFCASLSAALSKHAGFRVNRRVRDALVRGMAERPEDRWPTMDHLLRALHRGRSGLFQAVASVLKSKRAWAS